MQVLLVPDSQDVKDQEETMSTRLSFWKGPWSPAIERIGSIINVGDDIAFIRWSNEPSLSPTPLCRQVFHNFFVPVIIVIRSQPEHWPPAWRTPLCRQVFHFFVTVIVLFIVVSISWPLYRQDFFIPVIVNLFSLFLFSSPKILIQVEYTGWISIFTTFYEQNFHAATTYKDYVERFSTKRIRWIKGT